MLRRGWIGEPTTMSFTVNISTDWTAWNWLVESPRLDVNYHSIHYLDAIRSILGDPKTVFCTGSRTEGQLPIAETRSISTLIFPGDVRALVHVNHENRAREPEATFRIDGSDGSIRGSLGLLGTTRMAARTPSRSSHAPCPPTAGCPTRSRSDGCLMPSRGRWPPCCRGSMADRRPRRQPVTTSAPSGLSMPCIVRSTLEPHNAGRNECPGSGPQRPGASPSRTSRRARESTPPSSPG